MHACIDGNKSKLYNMYNDIKEVAILLQRSAQARLSTTMNVILLKCYGQIMAVIVILCLKINKSLHLRLL